MQINDAIQTWCRAENRRRWLGTRTALWWGVAGGMLAFGVVADNTIAQAAGPMFLGVWLVLADKPMSLRQLMPLESVPDSLLLVLADATEIPDWAKLAIADKLQDGPVHVRDLLDLDARLAVGFPRAQQERGEGAQKFAALRRAHAADHGANA